MAGYEFIDHMADYAMRARGSDFRELVRNALVGLMHLLADVEGLAVEEWAEVGVEGDCREEVLVRALKEVLYLQDDDRMAVAVEEVEVDDRGARFRVGMVPLVAHRERLEAQVKAVTYHDLEVREAEGGLVVEVVFDT